MKFRLFGRVFTLGKLLQIMKRQRNYLGYVQFLMIAWLFISDLDCLFGFCFSLWHKFLLILVGVVLWLPVVVFDTWVVYEQELAYGWRKNPEWRRLCDRLDRSESKLGDDE